MEITLTKTSLVLLSQVAEEFTKAANIVEKLQGKEANPSYCLVNNLGILVVLLLQNSTFEVNIINYCV